METVYIAPSNVKIVYWHLDSKTMTWDDFHLGIDQLKEQASDTDESFSVIMTTMGQIPKGDALAHIKRLIKVIGDHEMIEHFVIVNKQVDPVGQAFVRMALKLFAKHDKLQIAQSEEEALTFI